MYCFIYRLLYIHLTITKPKVPTMKKSINYILIALPIIFICLLAFAAAEKSSEKNTIIGVNNEVGSAMDFDNPFNSYIAFKFDESSKIDKEEMVEYWKEHLDIE